MGKKKKRKALYNPAEIRIVENLLGVFMRENHIPIVHETIGDTKREFEASNKLEEVAAKEKFTNDITKKILEPIVPILDLVLNENKKNKKFCKNNKKKIKKLEEKIADLEKEQQSLCHSIAFLASAMGTSSPNSSAEELEKDFKKLYKDFRKRKENKGCYFIEKNN